MGQTSMLWFMPTKSLCHDSCNSCKSPPFNLKSSCELHTQVTNWTTPPLPLPMLHCHHTAYFSPTFFTLLPIPLLLITNSRQLQWQIKLSTINVWPPLYSASMSSNTTLSLFIFNIHWCFYIFPCLGLHYSKSGEQNITLSHHPSILQTYPVTLLFYHRHQTVQTTPTSSCTVLTNSPCSQTIISCYHFQMLFNACTWTISSGAHEEIPICATSVIAMSHSSY